MKKLFILIFSIPMVLFGQEKHSGEFSLGGRNVVSMFNDGKFDDLGIGMGGQFRIRLAEKVNTEWFLDYIGTDIQSRANRKDYHIGWSVMYYPKHYHTKLVPYIVAGHCFDYTRVSEYANMTNTQERWSSAVQMGIGNHFNLTDKLDFSASAQYMMHMGGDLHVHIMNNDVHIEKQSGFDLEGHILCSFSVNYKIGKLWK